MKRILATVVVLTLAVPVWGRDYEKDLDAYEQRDEETALRVGFESHAARANLRTRSMTEAA